jgi:prepilin-type N-terminal cleavage/methylation domain-containing protein
LKSELRRQERGLTIIESLVALMILGIFVGVVLNLIVSTAFMANRSEQYNQAMNWIQADVENVRLLAREYEKNAFPFSPKCTQPTVSGLAASFITDTLGGAGTVQAGPKLLGGSQLILNRVSSYTTSPDPDKIVQLSYTVVPQGGGETIASFEMEVVPYAALRCP